MASEIEEVAGGVDQFRQFDVVTDYADHYFATEADEQKNAAALFKNAKSSVYKKIMQEWKILAESLPESIYVRTYETRIDLLRAVIIGARGTPYHDALFFFDIAFPEDYPNFPPKVYYRSYGLRVNPNLYSSGLVCLSLLNTWCGKKCEKWNPDYSSILQILVSIQALVLNAKPYYNEPSFRPALNYKVYNEKVFALNCRTMHYTIQAPPRNFREFVHAHFQQRGCSILKAIDAYKRGAALVGYYHQNYRPKHLKIKKSFASDLENLYNLILSDLVIIKTQGLEKLRHPEPLEEQESPLKNKDARKGIFRFLCNKVKKILKIGHTRPSSPKSKSSPTLI